MILKKTSVWIRYTIIISILIFGQIFLVSFNTNTIERDTYVSLNTQFVKKLQLDKRSSRENDFPKIWRERRSRIVRECAKLRHHKLNIKHIETQFVSKDKRFSQQIDLQSFLLDPERQNLFYWNRNIEEDVWKKFINQTEDLKKSHPKSILALQEAMAFYKNIILGKKYSDFFLHFAKSRIFDNSLQYFLTARI